MNKTSIRLLTIVLCIVLLSCCIFSVSAADSFYNINVLDYSFLDAGITHNKALTNGSTSFFYDMPFNTRIYNCQMLFKISRFTDVIDSITITDEENYSFTTDVLYLGSGYYRLLWNGDGRFTDRFTFTVNYTDSQGQRIDILNFSCSQVQASVFNPLFNSFITWYTPGNNILDRTFTGVNSFATEKISCIAYRVDFDFTDEWQKYDYLDLCLTLEGCTIDSVNVMLSDDVAVPFEINEIVATTADTTRTTYTFIISIDLTSVQREGDLYVLVRGSGGQTNDSIKVQSITCNSCTGYVRADSHDNPVTYWLQRIFNALKPTGSEGLADDFNDKVDDQKSELEGIKDSLDSVEKPNAADIDMNIDTYVPPSDLAVATAGLTSVMNNDIIVKLLLLTITFAIVGFILYGKR